jgi:uncharacterized membrane protein
MEEPRQRRKRRNPIWATLKALFRTRVTAGLLIVLPVYITYLLLTFVFFLMRDSSIWVVDSFLRSRMGEPVLDWWQVPSKQIDPETGRAVMITLTEKLDRLAEGLNRAPNTEEFYQILPTTLQWGISIASVFLTIFLLYLIGLFTANIFGRRIVETVERFFDKVPMVKTVYRSSKQILLTLTGSQSQNFQRVALIPFPQEKMRCVGFVTSTFFDSLSGEELATVFIPTTPNPTTGYLQVLRRKDLVEVDWTVEEAVRVIMSAGILRPDHLTIVPNKDQHKFGQAAAQLPRSSDQGESRFSDRPADDAR